MTIMEALGGHNGETIMEALGGKSGQTIADVIVEHGISPSEEVPSENDENTEPPEESSNGDSQE